MAINLPGENLPVGDLARIKSQEPNEEWPFLLEIVAYYDEGKGRRGKRRSIEITADQYFGRKGYGAPMTAEALMTIINKLRKDT